MTTTQGLHTISAEEYHDLPAIGRSGIMSFLKSPFHYYSEYLAPDRPPRTDTTSTIIGSAYHTLILEPDQFFKRYIVKPKKVQNLPKVPLLKDVGKELYTKAKEIYETARVKKNDLEAEFEINSVGKIILSQADYQSLLAMEERLLSHPRAQGTLKGALFEQTLIWTDTDTGLVCKARPDILNFGIGLKVADLKTCEDASLSAFQYHLEEYGYDIQAAMIREGLGQITGFDFQKFDFLPQEKQYPHAFAIYRLDLEVLSAARAIFKSALYELKKCLTSNVWPSYPSKVVTLRKRNY
jgi:PDDEXK-like domain of unknown function (DUF3799)